MVIQSCLKWCMEFDMLIRRADGWVFINFSMFHMANACSRIQQKENWTLRWRFQSGIASRIANVHIHIVSAFPFIRWKNNLLKASETWIFLISCIRSAAVDHSIQFENRFPFLLLQNIKEILFFLFLSLSGRNACSINFNSSYILFSSTGFTDHSKWANQLSG